MKHQNVRPLKLFGNLNRKKNKQKTGNCKISKLFGDYLNRSQRMLENI